MSKTKWYAKPIYVLVALVLVCSFSLVTAAPVVAAGPWYVDDTAGNDVLDGLADTWTDTDVDGVQEAGEPGPFKTITHAISQADTGDTINVAAGTYSEHVVIDKQLTLLGANHDVNPVTHPGERGPESIIDGTELTSAAGGLVQITEAADGIIFKGFTVRESLYSGGGIVSTSGSGNGLYENNIVSDNENMGFFIVGDGNIIRNNVVSNNRHSGEIGQINLQMGSDDNIIENNAISGDGRIQIKLWNAGNGNIIQNNVITGIGLEEFQEHYPGPDARTCGIGLSDVGNDTIIRGNTIAPEEGSLGFDYGIFTAGTRFGCSNTLVEDNIVHHCGIGIDPFQSVNALLRGNDVRWCEKGIRVLSAQDTTIEDNNILYNDVGISFYEAYPSTNTHINHNNIVGNTVGVQNESSTTVDATHNWWGTTDGSAIVATLSGNVDYSPWWGASYLIGTAPNIELVDHPWIWYTNDNIQDAIDAASSGDTINVAAGTYTEDVTITTPLQLLGAKFGVPAGPDASPANRGDPLEESTLEGTITEAKNVSGSTIDGFTILSNGQHGINLTPTERFGDVIKNNIIDGGPGNELSAGIWSARGGGYLITNNNIRNYLRGMMFDGWATDPQCTISGNYITSCSMVGIHTMGSWSNGHIFSNNLIEGNGSGMVLAQGEHQVSGNTIRNNSGSGLYIWADDNYSTRTFGIQITQNTIEGNATGIKLDGDDPSAVNNVAHFNNIVDNANGVINNHSAVFDATYNWWGDASGPSGGEGVYGTGDAVSDNVDYSPWLDAPAPDGKSISFVGAKQEPITNDTLDAKSESDTEVVVDGTATVTAAKYSDNPGSDFSGDIGKYIDVHIDSDEDVTELEIRLYYTDAEIATLGLDELSLRLKWWDGTAWVTCSPDSGVNTTDIDGYSGYMWAKVRATDTIPLLSALVGAPFGASGEPIAEPAAELLEYGDALDPTYPSFLLSDGARHLPTTTEILGLASTPDFKDFEFDADVPNLDLLDDGLVTTTITADNTAETVTFEVTDFIAPTSDLRVNILIDLNRDGDWADAGEHVVVNQPITTTATGIDEQVVVSTPFSTVGATPGLTWLRMTLTRHAIVNPPWDGTMTGYALMTPFEYGETEDWEITIEGVAPPPTGVGGTAYPPNKLAILAPWIALAAAIIAGATIFMRRRRAEG